MSKTLKFLMATTLGLGISLPTSVQADELPRAKCTMTIESDKHIKPNLAQASGVCNGQNFGWYVPASNNFIISGMASGVVSNGQTFVIGVVGSEQYVEADLTVYTVLKPKPAPTPPPPAPKPAPKPKPTAPTTTTPKPTAPKPSTSTTTTPRTTQPKTSTTAPKNTNKPGTSTTTTPAPKTTNINTSNKETTTKSNETKTASNKVTESKTDSKKEQTTKTPTKESKDNKKEVTEQSLSKLDKKESIASDEKSNKSNSVIWLSSIALLILVGGSIWFWKFRKVN